MLRLLCLAFLILPFLILPFLILPNLSVRAEEPKKEAWVPI